MSQEKSVLAGNEQSYHVSVYMRTYSTFDFLTVSWELEQHLALLAICLRQFLRKKSSIWSALTT